MNYGSDRRHYRSAAADEVTRAGGTPCQAEADVADFGQVDAAARRIEEALGPPLAAQRTREL